MPGLWKERDQEDPDDADKEDPHDEASHAVGFPVAVSVSAIRADRPGKVQFLRDRIDGCSGKDRCR